MNSSRKLLTFGRYYKAKIGQSVKKIPISISGFTCPNIDGTKARGGCSFCENESFSPNITKNKKRFFLNPNSNINPLLQEQLSEIQSQYDASKKSLKADKYIIYFQSWTNTYAPLETLKELYLKALSLEDVIGISIGTRADSISLEVLEFLKELNRDYDIWIEYGVQSIYDITLDKINRAEKANDVMQTIRLTKQMGIKVCVHFIFGLPDETQEMMLNTVKEIVKLNIDSVKFHPLYVVKNTTLAIEYQKGLFKPINQDFYIDTLIKAIKILDDKIIIQRLTAGIDNDTLLAPSWCRNKNNQLKQIKKVFKINQWDY